MGFKQNELYLKNENPELLLEYAKAACQRGEALGPVLFYGSRNCGQKEFAEKLADIYGTKLKILFPRIARKEVDLNTFFSDLWENDIVYIDEVDQINAGCSMFFKSVVEEATAHVKIGKGVASYDLEISFSRLNYVGHAERLEDVIPYIRDCFEYIIDVDSLGECSTENQRKLLSVCSSIGSSKRTTEAISKFLNQEANNRKEELAARIMKMIPELNDEQLVEKLEKGEIH